MRFYSVFAILLTLSSTLFSALSTAAPLDDGLTPKARAARKQIVSTHAASILDKAQCSQQAFDQFLARELLLNADEKVKVGASNLTAQQLNQTLIDRIGGIIRDFSAFDLELSYRSVCLGLYRIGDKNALSHVQGYLLFDPSLIDYLNSSFEKRSMYSLDQVVFHELAHQFQYWFGDRFDSDENVRRSELTADCVAGTLLAREGKRYSPDLWQITRKGMLEAAFDFGDFEFEDVNHHGIPLERYIAVNLGIDLPLSVTLKGVLNRCEEAIARQFQN